MDDWGDPWADAIEPRPAIPLVLAAHEEAIPIAILARFVDDTPWQSDGFGYSQDWGKDTLIRPHPQSTNVHIEDAYNSWDTTFLLNRLDNDDSLSIPTSGPQPKAQKHDRNLRQLTGNDFEPTDGRDKSVDNSVADAGGVGDDSFTSVASILASKRATLRSNEAATTNILGISGNAAFIDLPSADSSDGEGSTRPSTSPSEASRQDIYGSPRTSFEGDRTEDLQLDDIKSKHNEFLQGNSIAATIQDSCRDAEDRIGSHAGEQCSFESTSENIWQEEASIRNLTESSYRAYQDHDTHWHKGINENTSQTAHNDPCDFPTPADSLISSGTVNLVWRRLTRRETLREVRAGVDSNNYLRVTWRNSVIQDRVTDIANRWADEDHFYNTGIFGQGPSYAFRGSRGSTSKDCTILATETGKGTQQTLISAKRNSKAAVGLDLRHGCDPSSTIGCQTLSDSVPLLKELEGAQSTNTNSELLKSGNDNEPIEKTDETTSRILPAQTSVPGISSSCERGPAPSRIVQLKPRTETQKSEVVPFKSMIKPMLRNRVEDKLRLRPMKLKVALGPEGKFSLTKSPPPASSFSANSTSEDVVPGSDLPNDMKDNEEPASDPLGDADFSLFEATSNLTTVAAQSVSSAPSRNPMDETVPRILEKIPDLSYMLK